MSIFVYKIAPWCVFLKYRPSKLHLTRQGSSQGSTRFITCFYSQVFQGTGSVTSLLSYNHISC